MPLHAGSRLGRYEIVGPIGSGGMAEVYRARDPRLGRDVALKVIREAAQRQTELSRRFEQEARAVATLSHPNVLAIFDVGLNGERPYLVTELLEGETLRTLLERGALGGERALELALQIAAGLGAAHDRGIVHRDLKPENVIVTEAGHAKILDFGLARRMVDDEDAWVTCSRTLPGTVIGTLAYMAPEQVRGQAVDHRADIFAFGAILFEMLTGERAFDGISPADTISAILSAPPAVPSAGSGIVAAMAAVVRRCLEKDADRRFQSIHEVVRVMESISAARPATSAPLAGSGQTVAVLPFSNLGPEPATEFGDGLVEDLIDALTRLPGVRVVSRTSSIRFRNGETDVRQIGRELGVGAVLEGSVRRAGDRLRVVVRLTSTSDGYVVWSHRYDLGAADLFETGDAVAESVVSAIFRTAAPEREVPARPVPIDNICDARRRRPWCTAA